MGFFISEQNTQPITQNEPQNHFFLEQNLACRFTSETKKPLWNLEEEKWKKKAKNYAVRCICPSSIFIFYLTFNESTPLARIMSGMSRTSKIVIKTSFRC